MRRTLETASDIELVGIARDGVEAWNVALALAPDVLLLDDRMPNADGFAVLARLQGEAPGIRVVLHPSVSSTCVKAKALGATDCVEKTASGDALVRAIRGAVERS